MCTEIKLADMFLFFLVLISKSNSQRKTIPDLNRQAPCGHCPIIYSIENTVIKQADFQVTSCFHFDTTSINFAYIKSE
jgi:hypothetical protein